MKILSLYDGMACGMLAMQKAKIPVDRYVAYEIDKYAVQTSTHNFPQIEHKGDVFAGDFTEYKDFDFLIGGSPCTFWSCAQTKNRETEASGIGWELFSQYVRAVKEAEPKYFIYENNKSMSKQIRASITEAFGFEPICINSALVSAQNRQRLYWVGRRNEDGTYSKVEVEQPQDKGILLKDVLESGQSWINKSHCIDANYWKGGNLSSPKKQSGQRNMVAEPVNLTSDGKSHTIKAQYFKNSDANFLTNGGFDATAVAEPVGTTTDSKCFCLTSNYEGAYPEHTLTKHVRSMVAEPICVAERGRYSDNNEIEQQFEARTDGKTNTITSVQKDNQIAEPVFKELSEKEMDYMVRDYPDRRFNFMIKPGEKDKSVAITANISKGVPYNICAEPLRIGSFPSPNGELSTSQGMRIYDAKGKSVTLSANGGGLGAKTGLYAIPIEFENNVPTKAISCADSKTYTVYEVKDSQITIKGKQYPIKLADGFYIIRKLTVRECMRLQTVPEWYEFTWHANETQFFGEEVKICKNAKLRAAINLLQAKKLSYVTNIILGSYDTELRNLVENMLTTLKHAKEKGATESVELYKVTASCTTKSGNDNSLLTQQKNALFVMNQSDMQDVTECVLNIMLSGLDMEMLCIPRKNNVNLMEMLGVNTTKHLTEIGFIGLLQRKYLEESSLKTRLFIISTLISWIIIRTIYMFATVKPIYVCIGSWSEWQQHSLMMGLSFLKMGNIGGVSNSAAYKMLGNGWTVDVIVHLINSIKKLC